MQSHDGYIRMLPALPDVLPTGEVRGFRARGGFELDFSWENGELKKLTIHSNLGKRFILGSHRPLEVIEDGKPFEAIMTLLDGASAFDTEVGSVTLVCRGGGIT
jgi:alpha-L-fucosidase 2